VATFLPTASLDTWQWYNAQYITTASTTPINTNVPVFSTATTTTMYVNWKQN
jgi:hypothetical protein